jgi:hypothetical protein
MTRALQFRPDLLDEPNVLDVAIVEFAMLWPNDEDRRSRAMEASVILHLTETQALPIPRSAAEMSEMARLISNASRLADLSDDAKEANWRGVLAGKILLEAVGKSVLAPGLVNLSDLKKKLASGFGAALKVRLSEKTIDNRIWPEFRPVAPLWAAWLFVGDPRGRFPCQPAGLIDFLATAEAFRRLGETIHTPQSPKATILRPGETISISPSVALPIVTLEFKLKNPTAA